MTSTHHDPRHYDDDLSLKVPPMIWLTLVFLLRHLILLGITFMPTTGQEITLLREMIRPEYLLADLVALPVLVVALRRRPLAPAWMRRLWPAGRTLLSLSALVYLILLGRATITADGPLTETVNEGTLITALLNLAVILYLRQSTLARDLFRDFPRPPRLNRPR